MRKSSDGLCGHGFPSLWDLWFGLSWAAWAGLWLLFFLLLAQGRPIARLTAGVAIGQGVLTGWLPGYLLLSGVIM
ncbi:MAG TPA: AmiS/UreI family transporter [Rhodocyclaceae bacterium]|nr:AmiS/UreI family transporter [Rhodocyclaceae bacterium]